MFIPGLKADIGEPPLLSIDRYVQWMESLADHLGSIKHIGNYMKRQLARAMAMSLTKLPRSELITLAQLKKVHPDERHYIDRLALQHEHGELLCKCK